jgi:2-methylcitrate dehydratase PrpD
VAPLAVDLARWATELAPTADDLALADRSLLDTLAVTVGARNSSLVPIVAELPEAARWAALGHVLDFDDLHMESTAHISVVCVPAVLAAGDDGQRPEGAAARAYLAGAGVMARLGTALGWPHYSAGWHATCTSGAPAAAVAAAVALGLDAEATARALVLAVPAAGGVQRSFGTHGKPLQVGFAAEAGVRAARLAAAGATADPAVLDRWMPLVGGDPDAVSLDGPAVPGGLAVKVHPCCYALQRPIAAARELGVPADDVVRVRVRTPEATVQPLVHSRPTTGLEGKFSLEYSIATALLDGFPGFASFEDAAVRREEATRLVDLVEIELTEGGEGLLTGECLLELGLRDGRTVSTSVAVPPGAPTRPPTDEELTAKVRECAGELTDELLGVGWDGAADLLRTSLPVEAPVGVA